MIRLSIHHLPNIVFRAGQADFGAAGRLGGVVPSGGDLVRLRREQPASPCQPRPPMPQFAVLFSDGAGFGIEMVKALDAAHAKDITRAQHPTGRLSAVPAELLDGQDRHKLLAAWLRGEG